MIKHVLTAALGLAALTPALQAQEPEECRQVGLANVNWTGVSVKSHLMEEMLTALGYDVTLTTASVPIAFQAVASGERDAFLGLWLPTQEQMITPYLEEGEIAQAGDEPRRRQVHPGRTHLCARGRCHPSSATSMRIRTASRAASTASRRATTATS
ncbi:MAG: glycine betaine ABC transporter substrate-binding protein [Arhodomonas sp.]|nr:glycine betaine ABC transporter substrate-binding protein [Arhodomonas sp.]